MTSSSDPGHFFQTDSSLAALERKAAKSKNTAGNPIRLPSKLLAVVQDPFNDNDAVYVAESAGTVKRVVLSTGETSHVLKPSTNNLTPLTCLAYQLDSKPAMLFAGAWDKCIYGWGIELEPKETIATTKLVGHSDFVKCLAALPEGLLASGSSDKTIIIWDPVTGSKLFTLSSHLRAVSAIAADPINRSIVISGDSTREIRAWKFNRAACEEVSVRTLQTAAEGGQIEPLLVHETSILAMTYTDSGDLLTASADKAATLLSRMHGFAVDTVFKHPDFVGTIAGAESRGLIITGCRDEHVRVWDVSSGNCVATLKGHWEEVTGLAVLSAEKQVVSVSIDGTVRCWGLGKNEMDKAVKEYNESGDKKEEKKGVELTEDEERELAELMDDDED